MPLFGRRMAFPSLALLALLCAVAVPAAQTRASWEELSNLKKAIERCPAAGNKFVAAR